MTQAQWALLGPDPTDLSNPAPVQNRRECQLVSRHQGAVPRSRAWLSLNCEEVLTWKMHFGVGGHCLYKFIC